MYLKVHLETVHTYEPDQAEELIKRQLKKIEPGPQDLTVSELIPHCGPFSVLLMENVVTDMQPNRHCFY